MDLLIDYDDKIILGWVFLSNVPCCCASGLRSCQSRSILAMDTDLPSPSEVFGSQSSPNVLLQGQQIQGQPMNPMMMMWWLVVGVLWSALYQEGLQCLKIYCLDAISSLKLVYLSLTDHKLVDNRRLTKQIHVLTIWKPRIRKNISIYSKKETRSWRLVTWSHNPRTHIL